MEIGFALMKNKKLIKFEKGVNLDVREIAKILKNTDYDWALFHTRLASIGEKCDKNCHPFKRGNMVMAMNGTERSVSFLSKINDITDTEAILETMYKYNGVGLSAVQVGILKRVVVIDVEDGEGARVLINPKIVKTKGEQEVDEGCLSFPNQYAKIIRPKEVVVEALNENGKKVKIVAKDLLAQALSHEIDHLNGVLFVDNMIPGTLEYIDSKDNEEL